jgi:hypothetical protein
MKLIANGLNGEFFRSCLPPPGKEIDGVVAAIAYGDDKTTPRALYKKPSPT